jgi:DNA modification methylase
MQIVPITQVVPNTSNPRIIKDDKFKKLVKSIKEFPEMLNLRPIVVDADMVVLGGNMRLKACQAAGLKEVPILIADQLTPEQQAEFIIKDNVGFGEWDWDILANEWDAELLQDWGLELPFDNTPVLEAEEDDYEAPSEIKTDILLGDLIEIGQHRLLCGDSTDSDAVARLMNKLTPDMVLTDPPYGVNAVSRSGVLKESYKVDILGDSDTNAACDAFSLVYSLYPDASHIWWGANYYTLDAQLPNAKCWITWDKQEKNNHIDQADCELAWTNINSPSRIFHHLWAGFRRDSEKGEKRVHPTQKPIQLISEIVLHFKKVKSELILDLFLGSGSTMVAAHQLNRKCFGMELDPKYCQVIIDRMHKLDPSLEIKINGKLYGQD